MPLHKPAVSEMACLRAYNSKTKKDGLSRLSASMEDMSGEV